MGIFNSIGIIDPRYVNEPSRPISSADLESAPCFMIDTARDLRPAELISALTRLMMAELMSWCDRKLLSKRVIRRLFSDSQAEYAGVLISAPPDQAACVAAALDVLREHHPSLVCAMRRHVAVIGIVPFPARALPFHFPGRAIVLSQGEVTGAKADLMLALARKLWLNRFRHGSGFLSPCWVLYCEIKALRFEARASLRISGLAGDTASRRLDQRLQILRAMPCSRRVLRKCLGNCLG